MESPLSPRGTELNSPRSSSSSGSNDFAADLASLKSVEDYARIREDLNEAFTRKAFSEDRDSAFQILTGSIQRPGSDVSLASFQEESRLRSRLASTASQSQYSPPGSQSTLSVPQAEDLEQRLRELGPDLFEPMERRHHHSRHDQRHCVAKQNSALGNFLLERGNSSVSASRQSAKGSSKLSDYLVGKLCPEMENPQGTWGLDRKSTHRMVGKLGTGTKSFIMDEASTAAPSSAEQLSCEYGADQMARTTNARGTQAAHCRREAASSAGVAVNRSRHWLAR